jgi:hypothetical protein
MQRAERSSRALNMTREAEFAAGKKFSRSASAGASAASQRRKTRANHPTDSLRMRAHSTYSDRALNPAAASRTKFSLVFRLARKVRRAFCARVNRS